MNQQLPSSSSNKLNTKTLSLAAKSRRQLLLLGMVIFVGLVALVSYFSFYQIEQATDSYMGFDAAKLEQRLARDTNYVLPNSPEYSAYRRWQDIPSSIRQLFSEDELYSGVVLGDELTNAAGEREYVYLVYSNTLGKGGVYLIERSDAETVDALVNAIGERTIFDASVITGVFILLFFLIIGLMFQNALRPLNMLVDWSKQIKQNPDEEVKIDFSIKEVNEIAEHLMESLQQVQAHNIREQQFLKHASHELRTPLAIMQASLDTLAVRISADDPSFGALQRASRASSNMILLTEALLWLARQSHEPITRCTLEPAKLLQELMDDLSYLIAGKGIEVKLDSQSTQITIEKELFRIVLTNLLRNAFQHSSSGKIAITVNNNALTIVNPVDAGELPTVQSFGLGLQLVERIATKQQWQFSFQINQQGSQDKAFVSLCW